MEQTEEDGHWKPLWPTTPIVGVAAGALHPLGWPWDERDLAKMTRVVSWCTAQQKRMRACRPVLQCLGRLVHAKGSVDLGSLYYALV